MPYQSNRSLNSKVKKAHPGKKAQSVFRHAFNETLQRTGDEARAFRAGHSAARKVERRKK